MSCKWKFDNFFIHFDRGDKKTEREKKVFSFKVYTKVECYWKKNCVFVFSFMYLVSVDPMDRSLICENISLDQNVNVWDREKN